MDQPVEITVHENIEELSEKIKSPTFEAYKTLEGVFQGIERVIGDQIPKIFEELTERSSHKCLYVRLSLRKKSGAWDEGILLICNKKVLASHGVFDEKNYSGRESLEILARNINQDMYTAGLIEITELPIRFIKERLGVKIEEAVAEKEEEVKARKPPRLAAKPREEKIEEVIEGAEKTSVTIPVEMSMEKTKILSVEEAKKFLPPTIAPIMNIPGVKPPETIKEEKVKKPAKPLKIEEVMSVEDSILELNDRLIDLSSREKIHIIQAVVMGGYEELTIEIAITKLGLVNKRAKMIKIAETIAKVLEDILSKQRSPFRRITVIVRHGYDAVKITREVKATVYK